MSWDNQKNLRVAFLGTGAQGASIAADFAVAGLDVTFIDQWPDHIEAIRKNGITVNLPTRQINVKVPALHLCQVAEIKQPFDVVFLVVKAYDTKWATELIKSVLAPDGLIVGLQNGMTQSAARTQEIPQPVRGACPNEYRKQRWSDNGGAYQKRREAYPEISDFREAIVTLGGC